MSDTPRTTQEGTGTTDSQRAMQQLFALPMQGFLAAQRNAVETFVEGLELQDRAQRRSLELTKATMHSYLGTLERALPAPGGQQASAGGQYQGPAQQAAQPGTAQQVRQPQQANQAPGAVQPPQQLPQQQSQQQRQPRTLGDGQPQNGAAGTPEQAQFQGRPSGTTEGRRARTSRTDDDEDEPSEQAEE